MDKTKQNTSEPPKDYRLEIENGEVFHSFVKRKHGKQVVVRTSLRQLNLEAQKLKEAT